MNIFDSFGTFFQNNRLFGERKKDKPKLQRLQEIIFADMDKTRIEKFSKYKDKEKSIFNPKNQERTVHYKVERFYILERDLFSCIYCGIKNPEEGLQPDHVIPYHKLQKTHMDNLAAACYDCNNAKSNIPLRQATLLETLAIVAQRNSQAFPKFKQYRQNYLKLAKKANIE